MGVGELEDGLDVGGGERGEGDGGEEGREGGGGGGREEAAEEVEVGGEGRGVQVRGEIRVRVWDGSFGGVGGRGEGALAMGGGHVFFF